MKKEYFDEINFSLKKAAKTIKHLLPKIDKDRNYTITFDEFKTMFREMKLNLDEHKLEEIFKTIDYD